MGTSQGWRIRHPIALERYVTPEWDESYEPQIFRPARWNQVAPVLRTYCGWLDNPWLIEQRRRYARRDRLTAVEKLIQEYVANGALPPPGQFSLDAVCGRPPRRLAPTATAHKTRVPAQPSTGHVDHVVSEETLERLEARIISERRHPLARLVGLWHAGIAGPLGPSASIGGMLGRFPPASPCRLLCCFRGPYAEIGDGSGGASLSFGYGRMWDDLTRSGSFVRHAYMGIGSRGTLLRTWGQADGAHPGATYVGPEIQFSVATLHLYLGALRCLTAPHVGDRLITWGFGFGF